MMFEHFMAMLQKWATTTSDRQKLQHTYLAAMTVVTLVAGIVAYFDANNGHKVMFAVILMGVAFLANAVTWSLLNSAVLSKLAPVRRRK